MARTSGQSDQIQRQPLESRQHLEIRWLYVILVTAAIAISYFDRQTVSVAITAIQRTIPISNQQFSYLSTAFLLAYATLYIGGGRLLDRIGTRRGFVVIML
jgi:MFS transporter, ACS family, hexuronate transporter